MASLSQIKKIHILINKLGISEETYRDMLSSYGVDSSKNLTFLNAKDLLERLENKAESLGLWKKQTLKFSHLNRDKNMATPAQLRMIEGLWMEISYVKDDNFAKKSIRKILKNKYKADDLMFLTKYKANKVINGIKNIKKNVATFE